MYLQKFLNEDQTRDCIFIKISFKIGVGVSCRKLYCFVVYLYVNISGSITSVGKERANLSAVVYL